MKKFGFEEIGAVVATCEAQSGVKGGQVVKMTGSGKVGPCSEGDRFCGVAMEPRENVAGVQFKGFMKVNYTGTLTVGWGTLAANASGGVKNASTGVAAQIIQVNGDGTAVICL